MPDPQADAMIDQLRLANRRWKVLALSALAALVLAFGLTTFTALQVSREKAAAASARAEAEQARQETQEALENAARARTHTEQLLYASRVQQAQKAWEEGERERKKP